MMYLSQDAAFYSKINKYINKLLHDVLSQDAAFYSKINK